MQLVPANVVLYVDDGHPESRDYDDNYLVVPPRDRLVRARPTASAGHTRAASPSWWRRVLGALRPAHA